MTTDQSAQHTNTEAVDALASVWASGKHSLCTQMPGTAFRTVGFFDTPEELMAAALKLSDSNVWWGVHGVEFPPRRGRGGVDDVTSVIALSADFDWADPEAHSDAELPDELAVREAVHRIVPQPTLVIESGHGLQLYWRLDQELDARTGRKLSDGFFRYLEAEYGLHNDRTDLASILRVPGTYNQKTEPQRVVEIRQYDDDTCVLAEWIRDNAWLPEETSPGKASVAGSIPAAPLKGLANGGTVGSIPTLGTDESPKEFMCRTYDGYFGLLRLGWLPGRRRGDEEQMTRPGKDVRQGTSATFHHDTGVFNIFTSTVDHTYTMVGLESRGGVITLNPFDVYCIENRLDPREAMSIIRKTLMPSTPLPAAAGGATTKEKGEAEAAPSAAEGGDVPQGTNLPDEFWEARPLLSHIRQAAHARMEAPDAVLATLIARYATAIPTQTMIPPIIGAPATFDHLGCLVGPSGSGKSVAMAIAKELWVGPQYKTIVWDLPTGSGEGLISSFFEMVTEDDGGKKVLVNKKTKNAVHFSIDEGMALVSAGQRNGATIASVLCAAWAGQNPGQANASADKRRIALEAGTFRVSGVMGIQTSLGYNLLTEGWIEQGLSGRLLFASAEDPSIPFERPEWPGAIELPVHPATPRHMTYDEAIEAEVREAHWRKKTGSLVVSPIDGHRNLVRLKLSGILALMDYRQTVTLEDWDLATQMVATHEAIRNHMRSLEGESRRIKNVTAATAAAHFEITRDGEIEAHNVRLVKGAVMRKLEREGSANVRRIRNSLDAQKRPLLPLALEQLADEGKVIHRDEEWELC